MDKVLIAILIGLLAFVVAAPERVLGPNTPPAVSAGLDCWEIGEHMANGIAFLALLLMFAAFLILLPRSGRGTMSCHRCA